MIKDDLMNTMMKKRTNQSPSINQKNHSSDKKGWEIKKLGDICDIMNGGTPDTTIPKFWDGENLWLTPKDMGKLESIYVDDTLRKITDEGLKNSSAKVLPANSIILSSRAPIGHLAINTKPISTNQGCKGLIPKKGVFALYVYYFLSNSIDLLNSLGSGATFKELSGSKLAAVLIPVPSLTEQKQIVSILNETFAAIDRAKENAEKNLQNAKEIFSNYLHEIFQKKSEGWEKKILEDLVEETCTLSYGIVQPGDEHTNGLPIIRPTDLTSKFIGLNSLKRINPNLADGYKRTKLKGNELLLCVRGSTGVVSIALNELEGANVSRGIVPIRFNQKIINQEFAYYLLISSYIQKQIRAKTYGTALMQINIGDLREIVTPYPPLKIQQDILEKLDALSEQTTKLENIYKQKLSNLEELKKSILQKAFAGELSEL